jgi:hypothetical protein
MVTLDAARTDPEDVWSAMVATRSVSDAVGTLKKKDALYVQLYAVSSRHGSEGAHTCKPGINLDACSKG